MKILLVDPSLFTAPYDAALSNGLADNDIHPRWATRALRTDEEADIDEALHLSVFYPWTDGPNRRKGFGSRIIKGIEHAAGLRKLIHMSASEDLVHFQWALVPALDARAMHAIRRHCPVVLTVHDMVPYNGKAVSVLQTSGLTAVFQAADHIIVHTPEALEALTASGVVRQRLSVVPHGLLPLKASTATKRDDGRHDQRWRIVQFGKIQHYKGVDILIEALGLLDADSRSRLRIIVAGEPEIDMEPLFARARSLGLNDLLEFRPNRLSEAEMCHLLGSADAFLFPYRAIQASGVLLLIAGMGKWVVASDLGVFAEMIGRDDTAGALVTPEDPAALADAILASMGRRPSRSLASGVPDWTEIGRMTVKVYQAALDHWRTEQMRGAA
jgi:glycosyltransferase involved in cell wall biosynthesis